MSSAASGAVGRLVEPIEEPAPVDREPDRDREGDRLAGDEREHEPIHEPEDRIRIPRRPEAAGRRPARARQSLPDTLT